MRSIPSVCMRTSAARAAGRRHVPAPRMWNELIALAKHGAENGDQRRRRPHAPEFIVHEAENGRPSRTPDSFHDLTEATGIGPPENRAGFEVPGVSKVPDDRRCVLRESRSPSGETRFAFSTQRLAWTQSSPVGGIDCLLRAKANLLFRQRQLVKQ